MALQDTDNLIVSRAGTNYRMPASQLKDYAGAKVQISSSAPTSPEAGMLWWDTTSGRLYVWFTDVNSSQWVETSPQGIDASIFVNSAGDTMTGTLTVPNLNTTTLNDGPLAGTRNVIINGSMAIDQRNVGAAQTITAGAALAYTVDRFYAYCTGGNVTGQQIQGSSIGRFRYRFTGGASVSKIGFGQRIEQMNSVHLAGTTATLGVDLANSLLSTVTWTAYYANTTDSFGTLASPTRTQFATGTFTVNSTVSRYSAQIVIPSAANTGIEIEFSVASQTSGTWTIGNVQLERGTVATSFEHRSFGHELALCQRYFEWSPASLYIRGGTAGSTAGQHNIFSVTKRAVPTLGTVVTDPDYSGTPEAPGFSSLLVGWPTRIGCLVYGVIPGAGSAYAVGYRVSAAAEL